MAEQDGQSGSEGTQQRFQIEKVYVKDISFESPGAPGAFGKEWKPQVDLQLGHRSQQVGEKLYEVLLQITVTARNGEDTTFLVELQQAGLFTLNGFEEGELDRMLGVFCPSILFPYAREAVSDLVTRGGYPQLVLSPVNFEAIYRQHKEGQAAEGAAAERQE